MSSYFQASSFLYSNKLPSLHFTDTSIFWLFDLLHSFFTNIFKHHYYQFLAHSELLVLDSIYYLDVKVNSSKWNGWMLLDWLQLAIASRLGLVCFEFIYFSSFEHEWICQIVHTNWHDQKHWFSLTLRQYRFRHLSTLPISSFRNVERDSL